MRRIIGGACASSQRRAEAPAIGCQLSAVGTIVWPTAESLLTDSQQHDRNFNAITETYGSAQTVSSENTTRVLALGRGYNGRSLRKLLGGD